MTSNIGAKHHDISTLKQQIILAPQAPGVYTFHGNNQNYPLYIGKSVNIRTRLLSHLRNPNEARLMTQTSRISYLQTAGEISALLLEAQMIKEQQPLFNKRLRKTRDICSFALKENNIIIQRMNELDDDNKIELFGLFKNQRTAKERLRELADEHNLCLSVLGIEAHTKGRACFRSAIKKCAGACCGRENLQQHNQRLLSALNQYKIATWPYKGAVAVYERYGRIKQYHVLNNWRYQGSYKSERSLQNYKVQLNTLFDADMYRILVKPILLGEVNVIDLSISQ
ncbi:hypothetical protein ACLBWZ_14760 [Brucellaceae bacterium C25G]